MGFVLAGRVLVDDADAIAIEQPVGAPVFRRAGRRGGPRGRMLLPGAWEGSHEEATWSGPHMVRLHPVGRSYSVIRAWVATEDRFDGWYVNLEQPWRRTAIGFDSRDDILDVTVSDDLSRCGLKDDDELDYAVEVGLRTAADAETARATAELVMDAIAARRWPFDEAAWRQLGRLVTTEPVSVPAGWSQP